MFETTPRLAGRRLRALARLLQIPGVGDRLARIAIRERLIKPLRHRIADEETTRNIIPFRVQPRGPLQAGDDDQ